MKKSLLIRLLLLTFVCTLSSSAWADDEGMDCLAVESTSGEVTYFGLDHDPIITHSENSITIVSTKYTISDMPLDDVTNCYFTVDVPTGIGSIAADDERNTSFTNGKALVTNLRTGDKVYVYTADAQTVLTVAASADGDASVDLSNLKSGQVYILRTPTTSFKIIK